MFTKTIVSAIFGLGIFFQNTQVQSQEVVMAERLEATYTTYQGVTYAQIDMKRMPEMTKLGKCTLQKVNGELRVLFPGNLRIAYGTGMYPIEKKSFGEKWGDFIWSQTRKPKNQQGIVIGSVSDNEHSKINEISDFFFVTGGKDIPKEYSCR